MFNIGITLNNMKFVMKSAENNVKNAIFNAKTDQKVEKTGGKPIKYAIITV